MKLYDKFNAYVIEENDNHMTINKNNDAQHYDILESINELSNDSFCVINHLYVYEDRTDKFEDKFLQRNKYLQDEPGFKALRFLRPQEAGKHYIIITLWDDRQAFYDWQNSNAYAKTHQYRGTKKGVDYDIVNRELSYNIRIDLADLIVQYSR